MSIALVLSVITLAIGVLLGIVLESILGIFD